MIFRHSSVIVVLVTLFAATAILIATPDEALPVLTVCEVLSDLQGYEGKPVIVVGRSTSTDEGTWLDEECGHKVVRDGREFPTAISTAYVTDEFAAPPQKPIGFRWDKRLLKQKLEQVRRTTQLQRKHGKYSDHWLAMFGRLDTRLPRELKIEGNRVAYTNGFGHLSDAPAQLIPGGCMLLHAK